MSKFLKRAAMGLALLLTIGFAYPHSAFALVSRADLINNQRNLDRLSDKAGSLDQLIGELQNFRTFAATGAVVGTTVSVPGIMTTDTVSEIVVYSSACDFVGSTVIGRAGEGIITLNAKNYGVLSSRLSISITRKGTTDVSSGTLTIGTTGYAFEVKLASADARTQGTNEISSATAICNAINSHPWLGKLVVCVATGGVTTPSFSTAAFVTEVSPTIFTNQQFINNVPSGAWGGANNIQGYLLYKSTTGAFTGVYTLTNNGFVTIPSSGVVQISTSCPVQANDYIELKTYGYRSQ